ncbi:MAG TPA: hypothetical protein DIU15_12880 [Deltaproteobacteria bacterium]|nr:hypothetical protein [Deltaproteobacteria bacterium]
MDGSVRGPRIDHAFEGLTYGECPDPERPVAGCTSPIQFRIVGGQALGRGGEDDDDRDGVSSPSGLDLGPVVYTAVGGSYRRLALARDLGAGARKQGRIPLSGFQGALAGLNGDEPELPVREPELREDLDDNLVLGFETRGGIVLATGDLPEGKSDSELQALAGGAFVVTPGVEDSFDVDAVRSPSLVFDAGDGGLRVYYEGVANERSAIGLVMSADGETWVRHGDGGQVFGRGPAGAWDDASVGQPTVLWDADTSTFRMWYVGSDAATSRIGYAESVDGTEWVRHTDNAGVGTWVFDGAGLAFAQDGAFAPSVRKIDGGFEMWFEGRLDGSPRAGRARSTDGITWVPLTNPTTAGDTFTIVTREGDDEVNTGIDLGDDRQHAIFVDGEVVHGAGASEMVLSPDGRYAVVANKRWLLPGSAPAPGLVPTPAFLIVLDLHDDSEGDYVDANYNGIETLLQVPQRSDLVVGFRDMVFSEDGSELWVLQAPFVSPGDPGARSGPEALIRIDWSLVEDNDVAEVVRDDVVTGYVPLAPGVERDPGYWTEVSVGPSSLAISSDGRRGYVTNFNDNSLYIVDLQAGARGAVIDVISGLDENPWEVQLSPDERRAYVVNSYGVGRGPVQHSTLQVIDVDEDSVTYGRVLTRLSNVESRSDHGCD